MKKFTFLILLFSVSFIYAQETSVPTQNPTALSANEKQAEFPGGLNEFRNKVFTNLNTNKLKTQKGLIKTMVIFYIEKDGSVVDIKAYGIDKSFNDEAVKAISKIKEKWIPAEINGEKARTKYSLPLSMSFE